MTQGYKLLRFDNKLIRAEVIKNFLAGKKYDGVVCFSCGNATRALKKVGLTTIDISPSGDFIANHWFTPSDVAAIFPTYFDATSGHLSLEVMELIGKAFKEHLGELPNVNYVPSGSGETLVCLKLAYPDKKFVAVYNLDDATKFDEEATLNKLVSILADKIIK